MKNTMCINKCNKYLSNKPSNGTAPKYKNINLRTEVSLHTSTHLGNQKGSFFPPQKHRYYQYWNTTYKFKYTLKWNIHFSSLVSYFNRKNVVKLRCFLKIYYGLKFNRSGTLEWGLNLRKYNVHDQTREKESVNSSLPFLGRI